MTQSTNDHAAVHQQAVVEFQSGRIHQAVELFERACALNPTAAHYFSNLGFALILANRPGDAIERLTQSINLNPQFADAWNHLGSALRAAGRLEESIAAYQRAIVLNSAFVDPYVNLGDALREFGRIDDAIQACNFALALEPQSFSALNHLGNALKDKGLLDQAIAAYQRALAVNPQSFEVYTNLGAILRQSGKLPEAAASYRCAIQLRPEFADARNGLGACLRDLGEYDQAIASYEKAHALRPDWALPVYNLSLVNLVQGDFAKGWERYESRLRVPELAPAHRTIEGPRWTGDDLNGRSILIHAEQGFGDAIQFIRYISMVRDRGGRVIVQCFPELARLFKTVDGVDELVVGDQSLPKFDVHCPLVSLPYVFATNFQNIPAKVPYLNVDADLAAQWRDRLSRDEGKIKVGLAWAGKSQFIGDRFRSLSLSALAPLAKSAPRVQFVSLQLGPKAAEIAAVPELAVRDFSSELNDFSDTSALMENLDLVITTDTSVPHLAGALGKPVWLLLSHVPDWRWLLEREDSPWYPTMRLFRQPALGDWNSVIEKVAAALAAM